ncbi:transglutaminase-like domain-containing protein [Ancylomarina sp. YFZ004]
MKKIIFVLLLCISFSCTKKEHFLKDENYRSEITSKFESRSQIFQNRKTDLLDVFNLPISLREKEALMFLYAYMPLNDLADYSGDFFLEQVKYAFKTQNEFPWGKSVSEDNFRHFVLPYRVNNENLDSARSVFFNELKPRLKGFTMHEAALEVNHWCHEKVTYIGADIRTSAPLATVKNAKGRCGEESTFTVAAYRAVGIPARQCYTPRWAHCDDNHAWVEVCVDGKWQYVGACEPEAELNLGWFTQSAKKAMLVHTKVFGKYKGNERVTYQTDNFSELNLLEKYTKTQEITIQVVDEKGKSIKDAEVHYSVLNYAEFYPLVTKRTNNEGISKFTTGIGSLFIWVNKGDLYAFKDIDITKTKHLEISLSKNSKITDQEFNFDLNPSKQGGLSRSTPHNSENDAKLKNEDQIRKAYENTFISENKIIAFASKHQIDQELSLEYLQKSRGNYAEIISFIEQVPADKKDLIFPLLEVISEKDLHDTPASVLLDHILYSPETTDINEIYKNYILNPRIKNEILSPFRTEILSKFEKEFNDPKRANSTSIKDWISKNIKLTEKENYYKTPLTPLGSLELKTTDSESRDILYVAICRSFGIASRIEPATLKAQYYFENKWQNVQFKVSKEKKEAYAYISLKNTTKDFEIDPEYFKNFTIARVQDGKYKSLEFDFMKKLSAFDSKLSLQVGTYMLTTSNRKLNGGVLSKVSFFEVKANTTSQVGVDIPKINYTNQVYCDLDLNSNSQLKNLAKDQFLIIGWLAPDKEPTKHALVDFNKLKSEFENEEVSIAFIIPKEKQTESFSIKDHKLPKQTQFIEDNQLLQQLEIKTGQSLKNAYPVFCIVKPNADVVYLNKGYKIDIGLEILKLTKQLKRDSEQCRFIK